MVKIQNKRSKELLALEKIQLLFTFRCFLLLKDTRGKIRNLVVVNLRGMAPS